jgi:hypothetical protein
LYSRSSAAAPALVRRSPREIGKGGREHRDHGERSTGTRASQLLLEQRLHLVGMERPQVSG